MKKLYIQMFSIHGLLRYENMELGRDADTGGQIKYVIELAEALSRRDDVARVDLVTRLVADKTVSQDYARPIEEINDKFRIVRIQCGGRKYIRKELLWPHLDEFVDATIKFNLSQQEIPDIIHGHYADAGYVAMQLADFFGTPFVFTGHSLGRSKKAKLMDEGMQPQDIDKKYRIEHRIKVEETILKAADMIVTSTNQEIEEQYGLYDGGKHPHLRVIPPGLDIDKFHPYYYERLNEHEQDEMEMYARVSVIDELERFFSVPEKPVILALCRPDKRKNISGLVKAYGEDLELQAMANLAVFAGIRKDINQMEDNERDVLTEMLLLLDKYDLYGRMAIPKKHNFEYEVPQLYRIVAEKKGVFVNIAFTEPFGLTLLEASACGLPILATNDGGPRDIMANCQNGILVDPGDTAAIRKNLKHLITNSQEWKTFSQNGIVNVRKHYTWEAHVERYCEQLSQLMTEASHESFTPAQPSDVIGRRLFKLQRFLITDIDNTLTGPDNPDLEQLVADLEENRESIGFGVATGRTVESALEHLEKYSIPHPDIIISSVGTEIYYGPELIYARGWDAHISRHWNRERIQELLQDFDFLEYQEAATQRKFKVSYDMDPAKDRLAMIHYRLLENNCRYNLIYSHNKHLDIVPYRASKGKAIRYVSYKWGISPENILVSGDSGNDEEMLKGRPMAVVVGNYSPELEKLKGNRNIYFAGRKYAGGILEGFEHYSFITGGSNISAPEEHEAV